MKSAALQKCLILISLATMVGCSGFSVNSATNFAKSEGSSQSLMPIGTSTSSAFNLVPGQSRTLNNILLTMQIDGNLVLYRYGANKNEILWDAHTGGRVCSNNCLAAFQADGNLVLYQNGTPYWSTQTTGNKNAQLVMSSKPPYLSIQMNARTMWASGQHLNWFTALDRLGNYGADRPGMPDYMQLYKEGTWPKALSHVNVIKLYTQAILSKDDESLRTIFTFLKLHNIALAIEFPPIEANDSGCQGEGVTGAGTATSVANRIQSLGGDLTYVAMDEPLNFYYNTYLPKKLNCPFTSVAGMAQNVANMFVEFRKVFPAVQVGDIESQIPADQAADWADNFKAATGVSLAFFHDDALVETPSFQQNITNFQQVLAQRNIPYGLIRNGNNEATSDAQWMGVAESRIQIYNSLGVAQPDQNIFQSWNPYPTQVLSEDLPTSLTFLVNYLFPVAPANSIDASKFIVYRFYSPALTDHLYSNNDAEGLFAGYSPEGPAFSLFNSSGSSRAVLYRCTAGVKHFLSQDPSCESQHVEGGLGYVETQLSTIAPHPLYRCYNAFGHLETTNAIECQTTGFTIEGVIGFVP